MTWSATHQQQAVIDHDRGHALVSAVAGSGKTATLVHRVARRVAEQPDRTVRVLTFNRDAATEFEQRLAQLLPPRARVRVQTFHSLGYALTQHLTSEGWLPPAVVESGDQWLEQAARRWLRIAKERFHGGRRVTVSATEWDGFLNFYERAVGDTRPPGDLCTGDEPEYFPAAFNALEADRQEAGVRTLGHLLRDPVLCLQEHPEARQAVAGRIDELLADEFQDVNDVQFQLLRLLAGARAQVVACGDADQTIYAWRGARLDFIVDTFERVFRPTTRYALTYTMRYGHELAAIANHVIRNNAERPDTLCVSASDTPASRVRRVVADPGDGASVVAALQGAATDHSWSDVGVVCRLRALMVPVQLACLRGDIPYQVLDPRRSLFSLPEMRALVALLRLAAGRFADSGLRERQRDASALLSFPDVGLSSEAAHGIARRIAQNPDRAEAFILEGARHTSARARHEQITTRGQLWTTLASGRWQRVRADAAIDHYARMTELMGSRDMGTTDRETATRQLQCLLATRALASDINGDPGQVLDVLEELGEREQRREAEPCADAVRLTTVHRAKGLEWPIVVVPALSEGVFPSFQRGEPDLEAERRLFYVALTRAREAALLVMPPDPKLDAYIAGRRQQPPQQPRASRFVYEGVPGWALGRAARGERADLIARDPDCARRYLEAIGFSVEACAG